MVPKIYMADSRPVRSKAFEILQKAGEIIWAEDTGEEDLIRDLKNIDPEVIIVGARKITRNAIFSAKKLKGITVYGVSYDFVDVKAATERGVYVTHTPGVNAVSVAEFAIGLIFAIIKNIPQAYVTMKEGKWTNMTTFRFGFAGIELYQKTVGIVGLGNVGSNLGRRFNGLGARVISYTKNPSKERAKKHGVKFVDLDTLMSESDIIVVCCALTDETRGMIDKRKIGLMKQSAYFINVSRGAVVDEEGLLEALRNKKIAGAALDVIQREPTTESPFFDLDNVINTPHIAGRTHEAAMRLEMTVAEEAARIVQGKIPVHAVNKEEIKK